MRKMQFGRVIWVLAALTITQGSFANTNGEKVATQLSSALKSVGSRAGAVYPSISELAEELQDKAQEGSLGATPFIIGGTPAGRGRYREFTLVILTDGRGNITGICGGTLIARNKVLTAAHCSENSASSYFLLTNFYSFNDSITANDFFRLNRVARHPAYSSVRFDADIAVLTMTRNSLAPSIGIHVGSDKFVGESTRVIGVGLTSTNPVTDSSVLRETSAVVISNSECNRLWSQAAGITPITDRMICAGQANSGRGSCSGDSGGPLLFNIDGRTTIVGTVSFGFQTCEAQRGSQAYARVSAMESFIRRESPGSIFVEADQGVTITPILPIILDE